MSGKNTQLKFGKLPGTLLQNLISGLKTPNKDKRMIVGPGLGEDAAHILFGENTLLAKTDPITFATDRIGWYAVNVNANDIAVAGGTPKWFLATVMMPPGTSEDDVRRIFNQLGEAAAEIDVRLAGGHTEITPAVTQPVVCGFMLGEAPTSRTVSAAGAQPGDTIILTKGIAIEGTSILANECREALIKGGVAASDVDSAATLLKDPGISVLRDAKIAVDSGGVTAMHDPTEGGLATALQELAFASKAKIVIDEGAVNVLPLCGMVCEALDIDPWGLISSGALLAAVNPDRATGALAALNEAGIEATTIGNVESLLNDDQSPAVFVERGMGKPREPIKEFERDELARYFEALPN
ncbi:MAG: hypothetical protein F4X40_02260 [Chloroflexi bacterium]|nr:hypothetical protein [Chloroflexota bacterium]